MNTVILQLAVSIDGYIARKDGSVDYLEEFSEELTSHFNQFLSRIDVIIMGSNTYEVMLQFGDVPFTDKQIFVLTKRSFPNRYSHVHFTTETVPEILERVQGVIWLFGGAKLIQTCINLDIIDEYQLHIVPHIIGEGIPLFLPSKEIPNLSLLSKTQFGDSIELVYERMKNS